MIAFTIKVLAWAELAILTLVSVYYAFILEMPKVPEGVEVVPGLDQAAKAGFLLTGMMIFFGAMVTWALMLGFAKLIEDTEEIKKGINQ